MNKGFTLVELLVVLVILASIAVIASFGVINISKNINKEISETQKTLIINSAIKFGEDNKILLDGVCVDKYIVNGIDYENNIQNCLATTVQTLIDKRYIKSNKVDENNKKIIKDESTNEVLNNKKIFIYIINENIYAKFVENE